VKEDPSAISAERLLEVDEAAVASLVKWSSLPLQSERARLLREVGGKRLSTLLRSNSRCAVRKAENTRAM